MTASNTQPTIGESEYAQKCKKLYSLARALRDFGVHHDLMGVPRVVVIGGQSVGKSSLVEAVTGITLPRDSGTCTRCPMECSISTSSAEWTCTISLRFSYDAHGNHVGNTVTTPFSPVLSASQKKDVELWVRRAQAAILNSDDQPEVYKSMKAKDLKNLIDERPMTMLPFSRNLVVVDICDPDGTELCFVDVPGLLYNTEAEQADMIPLVKHLVEDEIKDSSTIILVTLAATMDMQLAQAKALAYAADPQGMRTIGVITKPDSVPDTSTSDLETWAKVLKGEAYPLTHGYFCVRLPDEADRKKGVTRAQANENALKYFRAKNPWKELLDLNRLGVSCLVSYVSKLLMKQLEEAHPRLTLQVSKLLNDYRAQLDALPKPIVVDAPTEVARRITAFCKDIHNTIYGISETKHFVHACRNRFEKLKVDICRTVPDFRPVVNAKLHSKRSRPTQHAEDDITMSDSEMAPMDITFVREVIRECTGWELPGNTPYDAKKFLMKMFIDRWFSPAEACFKDVLDALKAMVDVKLEERFGRFKALKQYMQSLVHPRVEELAESVRVILTEAVKHEQVPYYTLNVHYLLSSRDEWLRYHGYDTMTWRKTYEYEQEVLVMADVRAYFQVAHKRIIDSVPMTIQHRLNQSFADSLEDALVTEFMASLSRPEGMGLLKQMMAEDPAVTTKRRGIEEKIRALREIQRKLDEFSV